MAGVGVVSDKVRETELARMTEPIAQVWRCRSEIDASAFILDEKHLYCTKPRTIDDKIS